MKSSDGHQSWKQGNKSMCHICAISVVIRWRCRCYQKYLSENFPSFPKIKGKKMCHNCHLVNRKQRFFLQNTSNSWNIVPKTQKKVIQKNFQSFPKYGKFPGFTWKNLGWPCGSPNKHRILKDDGLVHELTQFDGVTQGSETSSLFFHACLHVTFIKPSRSRPIGFYPGKARTASDMRMLTDAFSKWV